MRAMCRKCETINKRNEEQELEVIYSIMDLKLRKYCLFIATELNLMQGTCTLCTRDPIKTG